MHSVSEGPRQHSVLLMQSPLGPSIAEQLQSDEQSHKCFGNVSAASCGLHTVTNCVHNTQGASRRCKMMSLWDAYAQLDWELLPRS